MSALRLSNNVKSIFAGFLRGFLSRLDGGPQVRRPTTFRVVAGRTGDQSARPLAPPRLETTVPEGPLSNGATDGTGQTPKADGAVTQDAPARNDSEVEMPLQPILEMLPADLRSKVTVAGVDLTRATIAVSADTVLPQLAHGAVKISFGELRRAAPALFQADAECDSLQIALPLRDVLARLSPALLVRHPAQKSLAAPDEISGPFGGRAQGVSFATTLLKPVSPSTTYFFRKAAPLPPPAKVEPSPVTPPPPSFVQRPTAPVPAAPVAPSAPRLDMVPRLRLDTDAGAPARQTPPPVRSPIPFSKTFTPPLPHVGDLVPPLRGTQIPPLRPAAPALPDVSSTILAPLGALSENWPETLRLEITQRDLSGAQVALPAHLVEAPLKHGRVIFSWRQLRSWIKPVPPDVSIHDATELELPLRVIAPLFLSWQKKSPRPQAGASLPPASVPNLFFSFPRPSTDLAPAQPPPPDAVAGINPPELISAPASHSNGSETPDALRVDVSEFKPPPQPATDFSSRRAMPKEIVERALRLPGVAGAVIALPDGLKVASQAPPELNADTLAAFLPQLFNRVTQCSNELRMGELRDLSFTVGNAPWKIFRVHSVFFAAFGRAGGALPEAQLAELAGQLERKN